MQPRNDRLSKFLVRKGAFVLLAIDEEGRRSIDAAAHAAEEIGLDFFCESPFRDCFSQPEIRKPKRPSQCKDERNSKLVLIFV